MPDQMKSQDEARRLALSHFVLLFLFYLGLVFVAPRNFVQYENVLPDGSHTAINTAIDIMHFMWKYWPVLIPTLVVLAYLDYRLCIWLNDDNRKWMISLWSLVVSAGIGTVGIWFIWALTQYSVGPWKFRNPGSVSPIILDMHYVAAAALAGIVACILVEIRLNRRQRKTQGEEGKSLGPRE